MPVKVAREPGSGLRGRGQRPRAQDGRVPDQRGLRRFRGVALRPHDSGISQPAERHRHRDTEDSRGNVAIVSWAGVQCSPRLRSRPCSSCRSRRTRCTRTCSPPEHLPLQGVEHSDIPMYIWMCRQSAPDEQRGQASPMTTSESQATCRIGFDIGGTFTDFILRVEGRAPRPRFRGGEGANRREVPASHS